MNDVTDPFANIEHPLNSPNFSVVKLPHVRLAFSYNTCIGFKSLKGTELGGRAYVTWGGWKIRENNWGPTTGKHMNLLNSSKKSRIPETEFKALLEAAISGTYYHLEQVAKQAFEELER